MFESIKIISECKKILKKHNIKYDESFRIYKKLGLDICIKIIEQHFISGHNYQII